MLLPTPAKLPPGPSSKSWTAAFKDYSRDPLGYLPRLAQQYGDIVTMRYYNFRVYFVSHPDYVEEVLVTQNRKFIKGRILRANKRLFGNGLLTSEGDFWLRQRRLAQPAFHRVRIATYADTMVRYTQSATFTPK
jgi:cytochrome P450